MRRVVAFGAGPTRNGRASGDQNYFYVFSVEATQVKMNTLGMAEQPARISFFVE